MDSSITFQDIENALINDEFIFYYQPKVSMITGEITGAEALIRWQKPNGQIILPSEFIPLAEESGFISTITKSMFQKLIIDITIINDTIENLMISMNVSSKDFANDSFIQQIKLAITRGLIDPNKLELELVESSLLDDDNTINASFLSLINIGVSLVMDDFGTGYSSIDILSKFPFSTVKLDRGLISRMHTSTKDKIIIESSIRMGHQLGINIVAEGIESEDTYLSLQNSGCTIGQGHWLSYPLPLYEFIKFSIQKKRWPSTPSGLLYMAQLDHIHWRKTLVDNVLKFNSNHTNSLAIKEKLISDARYCMLGKWYYGLGKIYAETPGYNELEAPHIELHALGNKLVLALEQGASKKNLIDIIRDISKLSNIVLMLLQNLEHETLYSLS